MNQSTDSVQKLIPSYPNPPVPVAVPEHLNAGYMQLALAQAFGSEKLQVESCVIECITQHGENFCSAIYRVNVSYRKCCTLPLERGTFILKDLLPEVAATESNEIHMFQEVLPAMENILKKAVPALADTQLSARCFLAECAAAKQTYLLEDLNALGYHAPDRCAGATYAEALVCLHKLAQFHAASMVLLEQQPQLSETLSPSHLSSGVADLVAKSIIFDGTLYTADFVANWPGMSDVAAKMRKQLPHIYNKRIKRVVNPQNAAIKVIAHGDMWFNNVMLTTQHEHCILVDFQSCYVCSPAVDLTYFFYTSLQLEVLLHQQDALLQHYYASLVKTLEFCQYTMPIPSYEVLLEEMERCLFYGYYAVVCEFPICCVSKAAAKNFTLHTIMNKEAMARKRPELYQNERVCKTLKATLGYFDKKGILDAL